MVKKKNKRIGVVYSTDSSYEPNVEEQTLEVEKQMLYVSLDIKQRKGKKVTLVEGFVGTLEDLKKLSKVLKNKCGVGGAIKNRMIEIQGDNRVKVLAILKEEGFCKAKVKGS